MGSQKTCEITLEEQHPNKELYFCWSKNSAANEQANAPSDFRLELSLLDKENPDHTSLSRHRQTLKQGFQTVSAVTVQHQEHVAKPLPLKIIPTTGAPTSPFSVDNSRFHPRKKLKDSQSQLLCEKAQKCVVQPYRRQSYSHLKMRHCNGRHNPVSVAADCIENHAGKLHGDGDSLALPLSPHLHPTVQNSSRSEPTVCGTWTSPLSTMVSHGEVCAPRKPKESDGVADMLKTDLDNRLDEQQSEATNQIKSEMQDEKATSVGAGNYLLGSRGDMLKLDILLDACSAFSKVTSADREVPRCSVGFKNGFTQQTERESEAERSLALSKHVFSATLPMPVAAPTFSAYAPMPVAAPTFSFGEPSLPLLSNCLQKPSEATKASTPSYKDSSALFHIPYTDLRRSPSYSPSPETVAAKNGSFGQLLAHQKRFLDLQAFLRLCDEAGEADLLQALRSMSAAGLSDHAHKLEARALKLSLEEGKEMIRLKMLNVMGRSLHPKRQTADTGSTPSGLQLPAPGIAATSSSQNA